MGFSFKVLERNLQTRKRVVAAGGGGRYLKIGKGRRPISRRNRSSTGDRGSSHLSNPPQIFMNRTSPVSEQKMEVKIINFKKTRGGEREWRGVILTG